MILNVLLAMELADKLLTKNELEVARAIQWSLQPDQRPRIDQLAIASHFHSPPEMWAATITISSRTVTTA